MFNKCRSFFATTAQFAPYVRKQSFRLAASMLLGFGYIFMGMLEPWPMKMIFDYVLLNRPEPSIISSTFGNRDPIRLLNIFVVAIILIALVRGVFYYYQQILVSRAGQQIVNRVRLDLYSHFHCLSLNFHYRKRKGDLLAHLTTDIRNLREMLISIPTIFCSDLLMMLGMASVMMFLDWQLTLIAFTVVPLLIILLGKYQTPLKNEIKRQRDSEGDLTVIASEVFEGIRAVQSFHQEKNELKRFSLQDKKSLNSGLRISHLLAKFRLSSDLVVAFVSAIILVVAGKRVLQGVLSPGDILVFIYYLRAFNKPLKRVSRISEKLTKGTNSGERIQEMMCIKPEVKDTAKAFNAKRFAGKISFRNVSYMYQEGFPILKNINLTIQAGESVAIVGPTGSGKSTLVSLIPRFYNLSSGQVLIDDVDVSRYTLSSLRKQISFVFQEPILFGITIAENIAYGKPDAKLKEIIGAAKKIHIHHMIESLSEGYETIVGERGGRLSGGQRQCIAIARAVIMDAPIVILDEPTSGLDISSTRLVMEALRELLKGRTVILISHQSDPLRIVDRTIKLHNGIIDETNAGKLNENTRSR